MNMEIEERLVLIVRDLFRQFDRVVDEYHLARLRGESDKMAVAIKEADMSLNEISDLYYVATGSHKSAPSVKKILKI